jgi:tyrosyl-tRNA synthetase
LPTVKITVAELGDGLGVVQLFVRAGLAESGKDAKRLIMEGGARINDEIVSDPALRLGAGHFVQAVKLTAGKKRHALVILE